MTQEEFEALAGEIAAALARRFEGFSAHPYICPAGFPSIGYGARFYEDGRAVKLSDPPISQEQADALLLRAIKRQFLPAVMRLCPNVDTPDRLAALVDFVYNLGAGRLRASTLRRKVNRGDWNGAKAQITRWVIGGGRVMRGLVRRREAERGLM